MKKDSMRRVIWFGAGLLFLTAVASLPSVSISAQEPSEPESTAGSAEATEEPAVDQDATSEGEPQTVENAANAAILIRQAYDVSQKAKFEEEFGAVIELCDKALAAPLDAQAQDYAKKLSAWAHNRRGELRAAGKADDTGLDDFETAIQLDPSRWKPFYNRAISYANSGRLDDALADLNRTIALKPDYIKALFNRGEVRFAQGDIEGSIQDYTQAIELQPRNSEAYSSRGFSYYSLGNYREAFRDFDRAIALDNRNADAHVNRADAYGDQGQFERAANGYRQAVRIDPNHGRAFLGWAWLLATCPVERYRDPEQALEYAQRAVELEGNSHYRYLDGLAAAYASAGQFEEAQKLQSQVIDAAPEDEKAKYQKRLDLYIAGKPYRDTAAQQAPAP